MDVYFTDATTGWAIGYSGTILKTTDGGTTWIAQTSGTSLRLHDAYFTDGATGWSVGDAGLILKTTDGGSIWSVQTSGTTRNLIGVHFTDSATGWVVGDYGTILKTTDGGATWSSQTSGTGTIFYSVYFIDVTTGWAFGNDGTIVKTTDGGITWIFQRIGTSNGLRGVYFTDETTGWVVGLVGTILKYKIGPGIYLDSAVLNFDTVSVSSSDSLKIVVHNYGVDPLNVSNISSTAEFTPTVTSFPAIAPSDSAVVSVVFTPSSFGEKLDTLFFTSDDQGNPVVTVIVQGTGKAAPGPDITVPSATVDIGKVIVNNSGIRLFMIKNEGDSTLTVSAISSDNSIFTVSPSSMSIAAFDSQMVTVTFSPIAASSNSAIITITSDDSDEGIVTITFSGTGISQTDVQINPGDIFVANKGFNQYTGNLVQIDTTTGTQTVLNSVDFVTVGDITFDSTGSLLITENSTGGKILRIDPSTGEKTAIVSSGVTLLDARGIAIDSNGDILVTNGQDRNIIRDRH